MREEAHQGLSNPSSIHHISVTSAYTFPKCQGGSPCEYCTRTNKVCQPQAVSSSQVQFVSCSSPEQTLSVVKLPMQVSEHSDTVYFDYFTRFMERCQFTQGFINLGADLLPLAQICPPLQEAILAIGALEASRRATVHSIDRQNSPHNVAFGSYCGSIRKLQDRLQTSDALRCQGVVWCTLLLGLFEVRTGLH